MQSANSKTLLNYVQVAGAHIQMHVPLNHSQVAIIRASGATNSPSSPPHTIFFYCLRVGKTWKAVEISRQMPSLRLILIWLFMNINTFPEWRQISIVKPIDRPHWSWYHFLVRKLEATWLRNASSLAFCLRTKLIEGSTFSINVHFCASHMRIWWIWYWYELFLLLLWYYLNRIPIHSLHRCDGEMHALPPTVRIQEILFRIFSKPHPLLRTYRYLVCTGEAMQGMN